MDIIRTINNVKQFAKNGDYKTAQYLLRPLFQKGYNELALFYMGKVYIRAGKEDLAWTYFNKLIEIDSHYREDIFWWLGKASLENNDFTTAKKHFCSLNGLNVDYKDEVFIDEAEVYYERGDLDTAIRLANKALANDPNNSRSLILLARVHYSNNNYNKSIKYINRILDNYDEYIIDAYKLLIKIQFELGHDEEATNYQSILSEFKNDTAKDYEILEDAYKDLKNGAHYQALNTFEYLVDNNKCFKSSRLGIEAANLLIAGDNYLRENNFDEAYKCYKKLFRKKACLAHALIGLKLARMFKEGDKLLLAGNPDLALATYKCALDEKIYTNMDEPNLEILAHLMYYNRLKIINNYEMLYNEPSKRYPNALIGNIYLESGNYDEAKKHYESALNERVCVSDALAGLLAIKVSNNDLKYIDDFVNQYRKELSKKQLSRIKGYIELAKKNENEKIFNDDERAENNKILINHLISTQYKRLK